jgi:hypothetical protein
MARRRSTRVAARRISLFWEKQPGCAKRVTIRAIRADWTGARQNATAIRASLRNF